MTVQAVTIIGNATGPRGPSGSPAPTVADVSTFQASSFGGVDTVFIAGYYGPGTPGGGLFTFDASAGPANGGTVLQDSGGRSFVRAQYTGSVYEWGAKCDATQIFSSGAISLASPNLFIITSVIPQSFKGAHIAIAGAGPSGATLATTIRDIDGTGLHITLTDAASSATPLYLPTAGRTIATGSLNYVAGDTSVMSDGTTIQVTGVNGSGTVTNFIVLAQGAWLSAIPAGNITQVSTSGIGTGFSCTLTYAASGQYVYGTDDSTAINNAIAANASGQYTCDTYIPENATCCVASPIVISAGRGHLRGFDRWKSGIIAVAQMSRVVWRDASAGFGGGVHDLFVDAFGLAPACTEQSNGRYFIWENVIQNNATLNGHAASGPSTDANGGTSYNNCFARFVQSVFASTALCQKYGFNFQNFGGPAFASNMQVSGVCTADPVNDPSACIRIQTTGIHVTTTNIFGAAPYSPVYGVDAGKQCTLIGVQVGGSTKAGVHISAAGVLCDNTFVQWGNANYQDPNNCHGVLIEATGIPFFVDRVVVTNTTCDPGLNAANIVTQIGTSGPNNIVQNNAGASYTYPAAAGGSSGVLYAQPATNLLQSTSLVSGGAHMGALLFNAYDAMIQAIGPTLWATGGLFYILATIDEATAALNLINPTGPSLLKVSSPTFTQYRGYTGNGSSAYLDTRVLSQNVPNVALGAMTMLSWTGNPDLAVDNSFAIGAVNQNRMHVNPKAANGNMRTKSQDTNTDDAVANSGDSVGMFGWSRATTSGYTQYIDGLPVATPTQTATTVSGGNILLLADGTFFSARTIAAGWIGGSLPSQDASVLTIHNAVKAFLQTVGAPT